MKKKKITRVILFIAMVLICIVIAVPFIIMFLTSLKTSAEIASPIFKLLPKEWLFSNYVEAMKSSN